MTNAEARCNKSLRARKPEGSLGRTAQGVHLDSHTAPELWAVSNRGPSTYQPNASPVGQTGSRTWRAQRASFNILDNEGHKTPHQSNKRKDDREKKKKKRKKEGVKGHDTVHSVTLKPLARVI